MLNLHKLKSLFNENTLKNTAWYIFLVISCLVIANLFVRMVDDPVLKVLFVVIAIGLDLFRQYTVSKAKQYWRINKGRSAALWLVYLVHFSIVIIASAGFTLSEVNLKSQSAGIYNMEKQSIINTINSNETEIKKLESLRGALDPAKWQFRETSNRIDVLQAANNEHYQRLGDFKEVKVNVKDDVFGNIGKVFRVKGEALEIYVFIVMAILIELALLITSKDIKTVSEMKEPGPETESQFKTETETLSESFETRTQTETNPGFRKFVTQTETELKPESREIETRTQTETNPEFRKFVTQTETESKPEFKEFETRTQTETNPGFRKFETRTETELKPESREFETQTQTETNPEFRKSVTQTETELKPESREFETRTQTETNPEFRKSVTQTETELKPESREFERRTQTQTNPGFRKFVTRTQTELKPEFREFEKRTRTQTNPGFRKFETRTRTQTQTKPKTLLREIKTQTQTEKNGNKMCPVCGKYFPFKHDDKVFCGSKCRSMAYRNKSTERVIQ